MKVQDWSDVVDDGFDESIVCHDQNLFLVTQRGSCKGFQYIEPFAALGGY